MIKPQPQAYRHDPENGSVGDCFRTCVGMCLGVDPLTIPHFAKDALEAEKIDGAAAVSVVQMLRDWLKPQGLGLAQFIFPPDHTIMDILHVTEVMSPDVPFMILGKSPRGDWGHVVVAINGKVADPASGTWRDDPWDALGGPTESVDGEEWWWVECIVHLPEQKKAG